MIEWLRSECDEVKEEVCAMEAIKDVSTVPPPVLTYSLNSLTSELGDVLFDAHMLASVTCKAFGIPQDAPFDAACSKVEARTGYMAQWGSGKGGTAGAGEEGDEEHEVPGETVEGGASAFPGPVTRAGAEAFWRSAKVRERSVDATLRASIGLPPKRRRTTLERRARRAGKAAKGSPEALVVAVAVGMGLGYAIGKAEGRGKK